MMQRLSLVLSTCLTTMSVLACASHDLGSSTHRDLRDAKWSATNRSGDNVASPGGSAAGDSSDGVSASLTSSVGDGTGAVITKTITSSGAVLQVKDVNLLRSSVEGCMGKGLLSITDDMLMPLDLNAKPAAPASDGRLLFLLATQYKAGDDIIDKEAPNLVDLSAGARTNITGDGLTDTYLRSLEAIGNVIAHNCSPSNQNCQCGSKEEALAMMTRCLPGLDPSTRDMADSAALLGAICSSGVDGMRKAVSSLISSYAFAVSR